MQNIYRKTPVWSLVLAATITSGATAAAPLLDKVQRQVHQHQAGQRVNQLTIHGGRPAFQIRPSNGYPGTQVSLDIARHYEIYEQGVRREFVVRRAVIDWGDGSNPFAVPGGQTARHTYGTRQDNGAISPTKGRDYIGRVTLHLEGGDTVTEQFRYVLWTDQQTLRRGGRLLPDEEQDQVWCAGGSRDGAYCVEHFDITRIVHSFEGCFDHNYIEIPVANAPAATFDVRSTATIAGGKYNQGWHVDWATNQIAAQYAGHYWVDSNRGKTDGKDNMSGIYYKFDPIALDNVTPELGQTRSHMVVDEASAAVVKSERSYTNRPFGSALRTQPSEANGWIARIELNDDGASGGSPPCPHGRRDSGGGWIKMDIEARIAGRIFSIPSANNEKLPSGYFNQEEYQVD